jgi:hypothetical protein
MTFPNGKAEAHGAAGHTYVKTEYKTVYYDPRDAQAEAGVVLALSAYAPAVQSLRYLPRVLEVLGLGLALESWFGELNLGPTNTRYMIMKEVYKSDNPTSNYYGYYQINIYNSATGETDYGDHMPIGKTSY